MATAQKRSYLGTFEAPGALDRCIRILVTSRIFLAIVQNRSIVGLHHRNSRYTGRFRNPPSGVFYFAIINLAKPRNFKFHSNLIAKYKKETCNKEADWKRATTTNMSKQLHKTRRSHKLETRQGQSNHVLRPSLCANQATHVHGESDCTFDIPITVGRFQIACNGGCFFGETCICAVAR